ncbi:MAG TPA: cob(I)yrinic acid a,c-diamide adenosyltransferase [Clostridiaceae bacterium]|nr:cob(I)yrinic acid a,c-diamide adenosyltransferase [Clostridiaceae bacterium]
MTNNKLTDEKKMTGLEQGLVHIYCGDGKGKTTACVGLTVRAASYGLRILFCQFLKSGTSGELSILKKLPTVEVLSGEPVNRFSWNMNDEEKKITRQFNDDRLREISQRIQNNEFDVVVLDEVIGTIDAGLLNGDVLLNLISAKPTTCELVMSGRNPAQALIDQADYVSEVIARKHPYETSGIVSRKGIEF